MADRKLVTMLVAILAMGLPGCGHRDERPKPIERSVPSPKAPAEPAPRERRESEPVLTDPSTPRRTGYKRMAMGGVAPSHSGNAVVLVDDEHRRGLVLTGSGVTSSPLAIHLARFGDGDRGSQALLAATVKKLGGAILSVRVDRLEDDVLYAAVLVLHEGKLREIEARPAEAFSLAVESDVPLFVAESVLDRAGVDLDKFDFRKIRRTSASALGEREDAVAL